MQITSYNFSIWPQLDSEEKKLREDRKREEMIEISQDMEQWKTQNKLLHSKVAEINDNVIDLNDREDLSTGKKKTRFSFLFFLFLLLDDGV